MIRNFEIEDAAAQTLKEKTGFEVYSNEVTEGFEIPCFFIKAKCVSTQPAGIGTVRKTVHVIINYFGPFEDGTEIRDEDDRAIVTAFLYKTFLRNIKVEGRTFLIVDQSDELGGENQDILIFTFNIDFFDDFDDEEEPLIEEISVNKNIK